MVGTPVVLIYSWEVVALGQEIILIWGMCVLNHGTLPFPQQKA